MLKNKFKLLTLFLIVILQVLLYTNNNQKSSFRYFKWTIQEVRIGKLISISFFSGLIMSTLLNVTITSSRKNNFEYIEENYDPTNNEEEIKSNIDIPPQRDIRDTQPTISVNYRVVKNMEDKNLNRNQNYSNSPVNNDDWQDEEDDW
ncbi:MAG: hypothetical protein JJ840_06395 [Prochlorococcus marinus CUG1431]|uniref:Uncharacterized protein n=1 Tax=Prochlorococcus marinus CUG1433 TaxID=2774506 RepID=A0A9D9BV07_PROMR|nr:hypothetical protein [Prochlorococcus marinus CUG1433]MBO6980976.1 hypothetical protein [Prochlorococcus marinus CUG1431]